MKELKKKLENEYKMLVLTAVVMKIRRNVFWDVAPSVLVDS
jgi:hypothetical protein